MSAGHRDIDRSAHPDHTIRLRALMAEPKFTAAIQGYKHTNEEHDIPFVGASNKAGDTIYFDRKFSDAVKRGKVRYDGQVYDPRPAMRVHEAVEGALIKHYGYDYPHAHELATSAERHAVESSGRDWDKHKASLRSAIAVAQAQKPRNLPKDLIETAGRNAHG